MSEESEKFVELMGRHFEEEGGARIAGRLMGVLMLNRDPASLDDLVAQLQVSKASVSMNARRLEMWGIAERMTVPGDRRDFYRIAPDIRERMLQRMIDRTRLLVARLGVGRGAVAAEAPDLCERFDSLIEFVDASLCRIEDDASVGEGGG